MHTSIIERELTDGSLVYDVVCIADGKKITFVMDGKEGANSLAWILRKRVSYIEVD